MNICKKIRHSLHDYALGKTDKSLSLEIERHCAECEECRRLLDAELLYCENLGAVRESFCSSSGDRSLADAVVGQIEREKEQPTVYTPRRRFPLATAAALFLITAAFIFARTSGMLEKAMDTAVNDNAAEAVTGSVTESARDDIAAKDEAGDKSANVTQAAPQAYFYTASYEQDETAEQENSAVKNKILMSASPAADDAEATVTAANSPALTAHKIIADYGDFLAANALHPVYPQIILHGGDRNFYYQNLVVKNSVSSSLTDGADFYCLNVPLADMEAQLKAADIADYTVILPEDASSTDMVYLYFRN